MSLGFGQTNKRTTLHTRPTDLITNAVIANTPQVILSWICFPDNGLLTLMSLAAESELYIRVLPPPEHLKMNKVQRVFSSCHTRSLLQSASSQRFDTGLCRSLSSWTWYSSMVTMKQQVGNFYQTTLGQEFHAATCYCLR
jgi:hypothetical protein